MIKPKTISGWPFPIYGNLSPASKQMLSGPNNIKKVVSSIQTLQAQKLKKFDQTADALFKPFSRTGK